MAHRFWGLNRGQHDVDVVEGAATGTKDLELNLDLSKNLTKQDVLVLIEAIRLKVMKDVWPPA